MVWTLHAMIFPSGCWHYDPKVSGNVLESSEYISWTLKTLERFEGVEEKTKGIPGDRLLHAYPHLSLSRSGWRPGFSWEEWERDWKGRSTGLECSLKCFHPVLQVKAAFDKLFFLLLNQGNGKFTAFAEEHCSWCEHDILGDGGRGNGGGGCERGEHGNQWVGLLVATCLIYMILFYPLESLCSRYHHPYFRDKGTEAWASMIMRFKSKDYWFCKTCLGSASLVLPTAWGCWQIRSIKLLRVWIQAPHLRASIRTHILLMDIHLVESPTSTFPKGLGKGIRIWSVINSLSRTRRILFLFIDGRHLLRGVTAAVIPMI